MVMDEAGSQPRKHTFSQRIWGILRILNVRLRFILLMILIGLIVGNWESISNHIDRLLRPVHITSPTAQQEVEYYCGMHPWIVQSTPGNCPICGMPLVKRAKTAKTELAPGVLAQVQLTPLKMVMGRIGTSPVEYRLLAREMRSVGIINYDETRRATINARVKGRLDELVVNYVGQKVEKGDPLAKMYSPDLIVAQQELLTAVKSGPQAPASGPARQLNQTLIDTARTKLLRLGLSARQIDEIIAAGQVQTQMTIESPISGIVTEKKVLQGNYVNEGDPIYTVADLSKVWLEVKIFENEVAGIEPGAAVEVTSTAYPDTIFAGRITFVAYEVDPATRTISARVEVANPDLHLKPGMFANAVIRLPLGKVEDADKVENGTAQSASAPATAAAATDSLARAYLDLTDQVFKGEASTAAIHFAASEAEVLRDKLPQAAKLSDEFAQLEGKNLQAKRDAFKAISADVISLLQQSPPSMELFIAYCPMVDAKWLTPAPEIHNPYSSDMPTCGSITGSIKPSGKAESERYAVGYYCPIYPDRLYDSPAQCPLDNFPFKRVQIEKVLAVPESAVIDTGTRTVAYRQESPGVFDMVEVHVGQRAGEFYPLLFGLDKGDQVATAGAFLVDAENRLNPAAAAQYFGASGGPPGQQVPTAAPAPSSSMPPNMPGMQH